jgi:serine/threonine-protein kinase RsbW
MITKTNEIIFSSEPSNIVLVEKFIEDVFKEGPIKDEMYGNVLVAVSEAVTNAMIHGNKSKEAKNVTLGISLPKENSVCFTIEDEGIGFDSEAVPDPTSPENIEKPHGRGIFLMRHLADKVEFEKNGARVLIEFSL